MYINYDGRHPCCEAVKSLNKKGMLFKNAPNLPLIECNVTVCKCQYVGIIDRRKRHRRQGTDRREEIRFEEKTDRRSGQDRRSDVWLERDD